ncbi:MAG: twin-arginine translocase TatA/TatE family subunit [bacterium]
MSYFPSVAFLTGSVGSGEWIVLFVVILIVVGPKRMPDVARKIGRMMEMFRRAADEFKDQLMTMDQESSASVTASTFSAPVSTDVDGVPSSGSSDASPAASYDDAYPNLSAHPGHEDPVENGSADALSDVSGPAEAHTAPTPEKPSEGDA